MGQPPKLNREISNDLEMGAYQLQLLAEKSKDACIDDLIRLSAEMDRIADTLLRDCSDD